MAEAALAGAPRRKQRPPPKIAAVQKIEQVTPKVIRVTFQGEELAEFGPPRPGGHIKLLFVPAGTTWDRFDPEQPRPPSRTYTPRSYDRDKRTLDVEFVLHGDGLAANWVQSAKVGDEMYISGPGGGYDVPADAATMIVVADDTAVPGAGTVIEAAPQGCAVTALCEVADAKEERTLSSRVSVSPRWLHRDSAQACSVLEREAIALDAPKDAHWWIACEANAMRRIRMHLLKERKVEPAKIHTRGYWRLGETNYPDHDYGND
jgi:NADPH-dependent ferric siderophore reductase